MESYNQLHITLRLNTILCPVVVRWKMHVAVGYGTPEYEISLFDKKNWTFLANVFLCSGRI